jgi:hypothetical protein
MIMNSVAFGDEKPLGLGGKIGAKAYIAESAAKMKDIDHIRETEEHESESIIHSCDLKSSSSNASCSSPSKNSSNNSGSDA